MSLRLVVHLVLSVYSPFEYVVGLFFAEKAYAHEAIVGLLKNHVDEHLSDFLGSIVFVLALLC